MNSLNYQQISGMAKELNHMYQILLQIALIYKSTICNILKWIRMDGMDCDSDEFRWIAIDKE